MYLKKKRIYQKTKNLRICKKFNRIYKKLRTFITLTFQEITYKQIKTKDAQKIHKYMELEKLKVL